MSNVIRPTFGSKAPAVEQPTSPPCHQVELYGTANGYLVGLIRDPVEPAGPALNVAVGRADGEGIETVATICDAKDAEICAEVIALGILRALEVIGEADTVPGVA